MYHRHFSTLSTSQSEPIPGRESDMVQGDSGGYQFKLDDWKSLDRFLILGVTGPTYYCSEKALVVRNAASILGLVKKDGERVVREVVNVSTKGRAVKNDPALFVLAMCAGEGDLATRQAAFQALSKVARIPTHLFHFLTYCKSFRGWGRGLREAVAAWYNDRPVDKLAYQVVKYRQRDGWTHQDVLRLTHPTPHDESHNALYRWITSPDKFDELDACIDIIDAFRVAQTTSSESRIVELIREHGLTREMIPTNFLKSPKAWEALLEKMPMTAMIRNLGVMGAVGLLTPGSWDVIETVVSRLADADRLHGSRIHPMSVLVAMKTYESGHGVRGKKMWPPVGKVVDALDEAFYLCFDNVKPIGKSIVIAVDASGSMTTPISGIPNLTCREAAVAMALITAHTEDRYTIVGFTNQDHIVHLPITPRQRLTDAMALLNRHTRGAGTDCALPIAQAARDNHKCDGFVILTDNESWGRNRHVAQELNAYRKKFGVRARMVVVAMVANSISIADPNDVDSLDVAGFDTSVPRVIAEFVAAA